MINTANKLNRIISSAKKVDSKNTDLNENQLFIDSYTSKKNDLKFLILLIPLAATLLLVRYLVDNKIIGINSKAGTGQASLFFQTNSTQIPPEFAAKVLVQTDGPVGFVSTEIVFNNNLVKIAAAPDISTSPLKKTIFITDVNEANNTGRMSLVMGLDPSKITSAPNGSFQLASIRFISATTSLNQNTSLSYNNSKSQVVNINKNVFNLSLNSLNMVINPSATMTATPTAVPTSTATSTPKLTATPTATTVATELPTMTATPNNSPRPSKTPRPRRFFDFLFWRFSY